MRMFFAFSETVITTVIILKHKRWYLPKLCRRLVLHE